MQGDWGGRGVQAGSGYQQAAGAGGLAVSAGRPAAGAGRSAAGAGWQQVPAARQRVQAGQVQVQVGSWCRQAVGSAGSSSYAGRRRQAGSRQEEPCQAGCLGNALPSHCWEPSCCWPGCAGVLVGWPQALPQRCLLFPSQLCLGAKLQPRVMGGKGDGDGEGMGSGGREAAGTGMAGVTVP